MERVALVLVILLIGFTPSRGQVCYENQKDFKKLCQNTLKGFVDGARCFFLPNFPGIWKNGFTTCKNQQGASLAQIHTSSEMGKIKPMFLRGSDTWIWIALARDATVTGGKWAIDLERTRWYETSTSTNPKFIANNTYARKRQQDDPFGGKTATCFDIWDDSGSKFADYKCDERLKPLCTLANYVETFELVKNTCMNEMVMETYTATLPVETCGTYCSHRMWCRSVNWYSTTGQCDLFSWHHSDTSNMLSGVADCYHYAYVP